MTLIESGSLDNIYGDGPRLRAWAALHDVLPLDVVPCAHGVYALDTCPALTGCQGSRLLDHASWWRRAGEESFLLAHTYLPPSDARAQLGTLCRPHGLDAFVGQSWDIWHGNSTTPVRFELGETWASRPSPLELALAAGVETWSPTVRDRMAEALR